MGWLGYRFLRDRGAVNGCCELSWEPCMAVVRQHALAHAWSAGRWSRIFRYGT